MSIGKSASFNGEDYPIAKWLFRRKYFDDSLYNERLVKIIHSNLDLADQNMTLVYLEEKQLHDKS